MVDSCTIRMRGLVASDLDAAGHRCLGRDFCGEHVVSDVQGDMGRAFGMVQFAMERFRDCDEEFGKMSQGVASNLAQQLSQSRKSRPQKFKWGFLKGRTLSEEEKQETR